MRVTLGLRVYWGLLLSLSSSSSHKLHLYVYSQHPWSCYYSKSSHEYNSILENIIHTTLCGVKDPSKFHFIFTDFLMFWYLIYFKIPFSLKWELLLCDLWVNWSFHASVLQLILSFPSRLSFSSFSPLFLAQFFWAKLQYPTFNFLMSLLLTQPCMCFIIISQLLAYVSLFPYYSELINKVGMQYWFNDNLPWSMFPYL